MHSKTFLATHGIGVFFLRLRRLFTSHCLSEDNTLKCTASRIQQTLHSSHFAGNPSHVCMVTKHLKTLLPQALFFFLYINNCNAHTAEPFHRKQPLSLEPAHKKKKKCVFNKCLASPPLDKKKVKCKNLKGHNS